MDKPSRVPVTLTPDERRRLDAIQAARTPSRGRAPSLDSLIGEAVSEWLSRQNQPQETAP